MIEDSGSVIKGVLWHQGCNDANEVLSVDYLERFTTLVENLRKDLKNSALPFYTVQLNKVTCCKGRLSSENNAWGQIREAQRKAALLIPNVYVVPSVDLTVCDGIHNCAASNMKIGERAANQALKYSYQINALCDAPMIRSAIMKTADTVEVAFDHVISRINTDLIPVERFPLVVEDDIGRIPLADYEPSGDTIILKLSREALENSYLHCAMEEFPVGVMQYDVDSYLPIMPFYKFKIN